QAGDAAGAAPAIRAYLGAVRLPAGRRAQLLYQLGGGLFDGGRFADAASTLRAAIPALDPPHAARATFTLARAQLRLDRTAAARASLLRVAELYANQAAAADALFLLGDLEQDAGHAARAAGWFRRVAALPSPPVPSGTVGDAYMRLGEMAYAAGQYAAAAQTYEAYRRRFPRGEEMEQATYWSARAYARLGQEGAARSRLQELARSPSLSYYVVLATARLGTPLLNALAGQAPGGEGEHHDLLTAGTERVDLLHELGLDQAASEEAATLRRRLGNDEPALYNLAEALDARGLTSPGITIGWELRRRSDGWNMRLLRIVYPFPYREAVVAEARAHGLDPYLVAGLIHQESNFKADARSRAGAVGLMQVMPGTGRALGRSNGIARVDAEELERPDVNVRLGTQFVAEMLRQAGGNVAEMLAAYNAGPARLERWRRFPEARDPELFAERIPYDETRSYVKIVQANARIYAALYPDLGRGDSAPGS
ncbi:MAG TPA: lytic transglycosylase domain-containing protein, partial [Longimicrobiales bacterium]